MAFWSDELAAGVKEPKRRFRFKISFTGFTGDGIVWMAKTVNKPNFQVTETEHTFLNHKFYSKAKSSSALGTIEIHQLDAEGLVIETWKLINPFIKSVKYGDLDYGNDELVEIELGLRYDWAECNIPATAGDAALDSAELEEIGGSAIENARQFFNTRAT